MMWFVSEFEVITDAEKQILAARDKNILAAALNAFNVAVKVNAEGMFYLAIIYQSTIKNPQKSAYWMKRSSDAGNLDASYWLGEFYVSGYGVPENRLKGVRMIREAAQKGNKKAIQSLRENGLSDNEMRSIGIPV